MPQNRIGGKISANRIAELEVQAVFDCMDTKADGLSEEEANARMAIYGENRIESRSSFNPIKSFAKQMVNLMAIMLWIASVLAIISGTPLLSYVIWMVILINGIFSFIQENKADKALQALAKMIPNNVKVYRDGEMKVTTADKLVPGDIVSLKAGDKVPADIRITESTGLLVDNSMLTGESLAVERDEVPHALEEGDSTVSRNLVFAGTSISGGEAKGVVYATGDESQIGNITQTSAHIIRKKSTLELQIQKITKTLIVISFVVGALAFLISTVATGIPVNAALIFAIGIIVADIPEGLMPTVSLSLAVGVQRMAKKNALVRKQSAVETLGSTTVICTDKTGTLTQNAMFAKKIWTYDGVVEISGEGYEKEGKITGFNDRSLEAVKKLLEASVLCSDTLIQTDRENPESWKIIGDPTEAAILIAAEKAGFETGSFRDHFEQLSVVPFNSDSKTMSVTVRDGNGDVVQYTKGDPGKLIEHCNYVFKEGKAEAMGPEDRENIMDINDGLASEGFRLLAVAYSDDAKGETTQNGLTLLGLVAMYDPPREGVAEAIADCYRAGIKVSVVTGDYSLTAAAIARQIGIICDHDYVTITGAEVESMSQEELAEKIDTEVPVIFARTTPNEKLKIVETYQSLGHVVASTGDGINDVLALRKADIGISMGKNGSDAAIESSDIVLLDDHFATIVEAVKEGRAIYDNIRKFITYILASNIPEVLPFLAMGILNIPPSLTILLILAIDLGTDLIPAISLGGEHPDESILDEPPRALDENILNKKVLLRSYGFLGMIEAGMAFAIYLFAWRYFGYSFEEMRSFNVAIANGTASEAVMQVYSYAITLSFGAVVAGQIGNVLECRSSRLPFTATLKKKNSMMIWGIVLEIALFLAIAYVPFFNMLFGTSAPKLEHLAMLIACPVVLIALEETRKWVVRRRFKIQ